jgi:Fur family peroxide stress response transcriptional regulator
MHFAPRARLPKNYEVIYDVIKHAGYGVHFTMSELYARVKRRRPSIGFSTVYRGVARLRDLAYVDEIELPGSGGAVYELAGKPHAHFRCEHCGKVEDVPYHLSRRAIAQLGRHSGATVRAAVIALVGECRACHPKRSA